MMMSELLFLFSKLFLMNAQLSLLVKEENFHGIIQLTSNLDSEARNQPDILRSRVRLEEHDESTVTFELILGFA